MDERHHRDCKREGTETKGRGTERETKRQEEMTSTFRVVRPSDPGSDRDRRH